MMWGRVLPEVERYARLDRPPDVLVIHAGGNDFGVRKIRALITDIKADFERLRAAFPGTVLVWSEIVARTQWRKARSVTKLNRARTRVNRVVGKFLARLGGLVVRHQELETNVGMYLRRDGVHLTDVGIALWSMGIQEGIQRALRLGGGP